MQVLPSTVVVFFCFVCLIELHRLHYSYILTMRNFTPRLYFFIFKVLPGGVVVGIILLAGASAPDLRSVVGNGTS